MQTQYLPIPNLARLGHKRLVAEPKPDLITIQRTPYPVLTNYLKLCRMLGVPPYCGRDFTDQGSANGVGCITSGYRDTDLNSPHEYGIAIDVIVGDVRAQVTAGRVALQYFCRVGLYPDNGIIHLDVAPEEWIVRHKKARFWVRYKGKYTTFNEYDEAACFAESLAI